MTEDKALPDSSPAAHKYRYYNAYKQKWGEGDAVLAVYFF
jgi:hypothetical protein